MSKSLHKGDEGNRQDGEAKARQSSDKESRPIWTRIGSGSKRSDRNPPAQRRTMQHDKSRQTSLHYGEYGGITDTTNTHHE